MKRLILVSAVFLTLALTAGCARHHGYGYEQGPPPHAPAHGYRARHHHHDLIYDAYLGVYIVPGYDDYYFYDDHYYRYYDGYWLYSRDLDDRWRRADYDRIPHKLRRSKEHYRDDRRDYDDYDDRHSNKRGRGYQDRDEYHANGRGRDYDDRDEHHGRGRGNDKHDGHPGNGRGNGQGEDEDWDHDRY